MPSNSSLLHESTAIHPAPCVCRQNLACQDMHIIVLRNVQCAAYNIWDVLALTQATYRVTQLAATQCAFYIKHSSLYGSVRLSNMRHRQPDPKQCTCSCTTTCQRVSLFPSQDDRVTTKNSSRTKVSLSRTWSQSHWRPAERSLHLPHMHSSAKQQEQWLPVQAQGLLQL